MRSLHTCNKNWCLKKEFYICGHKYNRLIFFPRALKCMMKMIKKIISFEISLFGFIAFQEVQLLDIFPQETGFLINYILL
jgi:hypothetical protein